MKAAVLVVALSASLGTTALGGQSPALTDTWLDLITYAGDVFGVRMGMHQPTEDLVTVMGYLVGRQARWIDVDPVRTALANDLRVSWEVFTSLLAAFHQNERLLELGVGAMYGAYQTEAEAAIRRLGGHVPADPPDLAAYLGWPEPPGMATPQSPPPPSPAAPAPSSGPPPGPPPPPSSSSAGATPLQVSGGTGQGTLALYGQPVCTWQVQLIITGGVVDESLFSPTYGQTVVTVPQESEFHVQLYHPGLDRVARLEGSRARHVLEAKGYFRGFGSQAVEGWISTPAYDDFVTYGTGAPAPVSACSAPAPTPTPVRGPQVLRGVVVGSAQTLNHGNRATYHVVWRIANPFGVDVRFAGGKIRAWETRVDGSGRSAGGEYVTRPSGPFTVAAGGQETTADLTLPCVNGTCQGSYSAVYEGVDGAGNVVRLILEFP